MTSDKEIYDSWKRKSRFHWRGSLVNHSGTRAIVRHYWWCQFSVVEVEVLHRYAKPVAVSTQKLGPDALDGMTGEEQIEEELEDRMFTEPELQLTEEFETTIKEFEASG